MKANRIGAGALALAVALTAIAGYRLATGTWPSLEALTSWRDASPTTPTAANPSQPRLSFALYWRSPGGKPDYLLTPTKTADGRDYLPVYDEEGVEPALVEGKPI